MGEPVSSVNRRQLNSEPVERMEGLENGCKIKKELYLSVHYRVKDRGLRPAFEVGFSLCVLCVLCVFVVNLLEIDPPQRHKGHKGRTERGGTDLIPKLNRFLRPSHRN